MTDPAATMVSTVNTVQAALTAVTALTLTDYLFQENCTVSNASYWDYIVVGGGSAGSIVAHRLSVNYSVLLIEWGGNPPVETIYPGIFTVLPGADYDSTFCSVNDNKTTLNLQGSCVNLTQGTMLGGSSCLNHMIYVQGDPYDYNEWATLTGDNCWNYTNVLPYLKKVENLTDPTILESSKAELHGTSGYIKLKTQTSSANDKIKSALKELGYEYVIDISSNTSTLGYTDPLFTIGDGMRYCSATGYLNAARSHSKLCIAKTTKVTNLVIENSTVVGVQAITAGNFLYTFYTNKEVIVSAGGIRSPHLLMLSGIGPKEQLESNSIECLADLPVGQNLMDHTGCGLLYTLEENNSTTPASNPHEFPVNIVTLNAAINETQSNPDFQVIMLFFPPSSSGLLQLLSNSFRLSNDVCNKYYEASTDRNMMFAIMNLMKPKSRGNVTIVSSDHTVNPKVELGSYTNSSDSEMMVASIKQYNQILNTTYFQGINATLVDADKCTNYTTKYSSREECVMMELYNNMWHYSGTCSMGKVVDSSMRVKGIQNLRVVDASVMPTLTSGNIYAAVAMLAERASDLILYGDNIC